MARDVGITVENSFVRGLITEATGLNYPENACIETENCIFDQTGEVYRRPGVEYEADFSIFATAVEDVAITEYVWRGVSQNGELTFFVVQVGNVVSFFRADVEGGVSSNSESFGVYLDLYKAPGAPDTQGIQCSFAAGNGLLFITHPYCNPVYVEYNEFTRQITTTQIDIKIRDVHGLPNVDAFGNTVDVEARPAEAAMTPAIHYNLNNQGWYVTTNCTTNNKTYTNTNVKTFFRNNAGAYPAESETWWIYKAPLIPIVFDGNVVAGLPKEAMSKLEFDAERFGSTPAPKGHYLLDAFYQDRSTVSGVGGIDIVSSGYQRPSQCVFFAGRIFYAGVSATDFNTKIYFSQILDGKNNIEKCYKELDPTAEEAGDLLPTDGGIIEIPEIAKIVKLWPAGSSIICFASNGVWAISGSEGIGFTAVDYNVTRLSSIPALGPGSFIDVDGTPMWWNLDGIYTLKQQVAGGPPTVESLTNSTIRDFYQAIPAASKRYAKGAFNTFTRVAQWLYRSEEEANITERYAYDRILNLDVSSAAFYPWTLPDECVKLSGITVLLGQGILYTPEDVIVDDEVVTVNAETVRSNRSTRTELSSRFKYLVQNTCQNVDVDDAEIGVSYDYQFYGNLDNASGWGGSSTSPRQGQVLVGEDGSIGLIADRSPNSSDAIQLYNGTATYVATTGTENWNNVTGVVPEAIINGWTNSSVGAGDGVFAVGYPHTPYYLLFSLVRGTVGLDMGFAVGLYKINGDGESEFLAGQVWQETWFHAIASRVVGAAGYKGLPTSSNFENDRLYFHLQNTGAFSAANGFLIEMDSINEFLAGNGEFLPDDTNWTARSVPGWLVSGYNGTWSLPPYKQWIVSTETGGVWSNKFFVYVDKYESQYYIDNPAHFLHNALINTTAPDYPDGFVLGWDFTTQTWEVCNDDFRNSGGGSLIPFTDEGYNIDNSVGSTQYNVWKSPSVSWDVANEVQYLTWLRVYDNVNAPTLNGSPLGVNAKVIVQVWDPPSQTATFVDSLDGPSLNTVADMGVAEASRYTFFPTKHAFAFMLPGLTEIFIAYIKLDQGTVPYQRQYIVTKFANANLTVTLDDIGLSFAEFSNDSTYLDWVQELGGVDYTSFFVPGYKIRGDGIRKFQSQYVRLYTRNIVPSQFDFSSRWDYSNSADTGRWSQPQRVTMDDTNYDYRTKRLKVRGHGLALTFKVQSISQQPFNIIGWSVFESANKLP